MAAKHLEDDGAGRRRSRERPRGSASGGTSTLRELPGHLTWREIPGLEGLRETAQEPGLRLRLKPWSRVDTAGVIWIVMLAHGRAERGLDFRLEPLEPHQRRVFDLCSPGLARILQKGWCAGERPRVQAGPSKTMGRSKAMGRRRPSSVGGS